MSRYASGRKYADAVAGLLQVQPGLFVRAMKEAQMLLTAFDKLNDEQPRSTMSPRPWAASAWRVS